jgi:ribosomal protein S18 acetylase RimI-like enzyme
MSTPMKARPGLIVRPVAVAETRPLRQAVLRPHQTVEELTESEPADVAAVGVFEEEELIAVGLIGPEGEPGYWRVRGMATAPAARRRGAGTAVLQALLDHARAHGGRHVWASVRVPARNLYGRAGFQVTSEAFEPPDIGPHVTMELGLEQDGEAR